MITEGRAVEHLRNQLVEVADNAGAFDTGEAVVTIADAITVALAAQPEGMVPSGDWVMVPRRPTINMLAAWWRQRNRGTQEVGAPENDLGKSDFDCYAAMLAAAPAALTPASTITGEAIPAGMTAWHGGDTAPEDWDGGDVLGDDGRMYGPEAVMWQHGLRRRGIGSDIIAYTPKAPPAPSEQPAPSREEVDTRWIYRALQPEMNKLANGPASWQDQAQACQVVAEQALAKFAASPRSPNDDMESVERFGATMFSELWERFTDGGFEIEIHDLIAIEAVRAGLVKTVPFDPEQHDDDTGAEPGSTWYQVTNAGRRALKATLTRLNEAPTVDKRGEGKVDVDDALAFADQIAEQHRQRANDAEERIKGALDSLIAPGETWQAYAFRLRATLSPNPEHHHAG